MTKHRTNPLLCLALLGGVTGCGSGGGEPTTPVVTDSIGKDIFARGAEVLTWTQAQKVASFPVMDTLFPAHIARRGPTVRALPTGLPLTTLTPTPAAQQALDDFIVSQQVAGLLILHNGNVRLERYALGQTANSRWTSWSIAKSVTQLLVGAAIKDGYISSIDALVTAYIPQLRGTAYDGVTVRQMLTMTSGVAWNENYTDPNSDIVRFTRYIPVQGLDANVGFASTLRREAAPGSRWQYKTPESNLLGSLVIAATNRPLATYLSEKVWAPYGMERDATWLVDHVGHEQGGAGFQATLRDFARFGQLMLDNGVVNGQSVVPAGWIDAATRTRYGIGVPGRGYGYQFWTFDDGTYQARGLWGQLIHIDPARHLVVVVIGAWTQPDASASHDLQKQLVAAISAAVDVQP
ncbi:MAG: serine hydrolase [Gemmatimonadaceae bacterium]|nr:serine hydrolase [Gemmatimonadaceae bacterium]